tara:strand:- start:6163 stop:6777 length:615 start_codon:yes stop_codon:yes gene_type:complete
MKRTELVCIIVALIAVILRLFHYPGGGPLIVLSLSLLSLLYFYGGILLFLDIPIKKIANSGTFKELPTLRIVGAGLTGATLSVMVIGLLFKWQSYPGSFSMMIIGLGSMAVITVLSFWKWKKSAHPFYIDILKRVVVYSLIGWVLLGIPTRMWLNFKFPDNPQLVEALVALDKDRSNPELQEEANKQWDLYYNQFQNAQDEEGD